AIGIARIGPKGRADDRPTRRQRPPRPPDVQRGDVPVADRLLPPRVRGDAGDGEFDFDEAFGEFGHRAYHNQSAWIVSTSARISSTLANAARACSLETWGFRRLTSAASFSTLAFGF